MAATEGESMRLALMNRPQVEEYLTRGDTLIIPAGATEQHGPNGLLGTDHLVAEAIAQAVGEQAGIPVHPTLSLGMSLHHLDFAGTSSLTASTFGLVISELIGSMARHGFRRFYFINGHGGNTAAAEAAASDLLLRREDIHFHWRGWWTDPQVKTLEDELFEDRNGDHATAAEISITKHLFPGLVQEIGPCTIDRPEHDWPLSPARFRELFPDGRMYSDPSLATAEAGRRLFDLCVEIMAEELRELTGPVDPDQPD
jgi:creatinine amidohydrolase